MCIQEKLNFNKFLTEENMRLISCLLQRANMAEWSKKYANLPESYLKRVMEKVWTIKLLKKWCVTFIFNILLRYCLLIWIYLFLINLWNMISLSGGHLEKSIICHVQLEENNIFTPCIVHGLHDFSWIINLVVTQNSFMLSPLRTGLSFVVTGYINYLHI